MRSALVSLVVLCNALTNRPPGLPGDMASPPGMPTQFVASAPASSGFRLDEICSSNCLRGKTGRFLTSPNHSPMVTMDGAITWNISGTIPDLRPVKTTALIPPFRRSIGHFGHLEPSGAHFGDSLTHQVEPRGPRSTHLRQARGSTRAYVQVHRRLPHGHQGIRHIGPHHREAACFMGPHV